MARHEAFMKRSIDLMGVFVRGKNTPRLIGLKRHFAHINALMHGCGKKRGRKGAIGLSTALYLNIQHIGQHLAEKIALPASAQNMQGFGALPQFPRHIMPNGGQNMAHPLIGGSRHMVGRMRSRQAKHFGAEIGLPKWRTRTGQIGVK